MPVNSGVQGASSLKALALTMVVLPTVSGEEKTGPSASGVVPSKVQTIFAPSVSQERLSSKGSS